jgi:hypothetical protein
MPAIITLGFLSGLFAFLSRWRRTSWGLRASFVVIFVFTALRYNYGWDYNTYLQTFGEVRDNGLFDFNNSHDFEPAWICLNELFCPLGFFGMIAALAFVNCLVYYHLIKTHVPVTYYWVAVCLYVFNPIFMLIQLSALRQTVAILLFLVSLEFIHKKQPIRYFLCIGLASLFHLSAVLLLPLYLLALANWNANLASKRVTRIIVVSIFVLLFVFGLNGSLGNLLRDFVADYFERYQTYQDPGKLGTGLGFLYGTIMLVLALFYATSPKESTSLVCRIAIISFMLAPLTLSIELLSRVCFYFAPATLVAYPIIVQNLKAPLLRVLLLTVLFSLTFWELGVFCNGVDNQEYYGTYQTIFSASEWF